MAEIKGGQKFAKVLARIAANASNASLVRVGFLEGATYPNGTPVAMIAAIQDFGAPSVGIPPRPFFRNMIAAKKGEWPKAIGDELVARNYNAEQTLAAVGETVAGQLRESIKNTNSPPLAESTLRKRGVAGMVYDPKDTSTFGAKPLIASGTMYGSVDKEVVKR